MDKKWEMPTTGALWETAGAVATDRSGFDLCPSLTFYMTRNKLINLSELYLFLISKMEMKPLLQEFKVRCVDKLFKNWKLLLE